MNLKYEFTIREIAGEYVLIPMGKSALAFSGMVTTNAVGATVCRRLAEPATKQELLEAICEEFAVEEETARRDLEEFLILLRGADLLEE